MATQPITILHVEDNEGFAELLQVYFQHHYNDINVCVVSTRDEALAHLEAAEDVDCVVSDYNMPGIDGLELLESVRDRWPDLPFILFTGQGNEKVAMRAINAGVTDYLHKRASASLFSMLANRVRSLVTERCAETELKWAARQTEVQFKLLVNTIEDYAIYFLDADGYIRTWNKGAEDIKGYTSEEIIGEHYSVFYLEEDVAAGIPDRSLREAADEGTVADEGWRVRKDGSTFWVGMRLMSFHEDDELVGYAEVTRDRTPRHRDQVLLEQNERLQSIIAAISHDLRSPLAVIGGNVKMARETGDLSVLDGTEKGLDRATELLDYLETLATTDTQLKETEPVELRDTAEAAWAVLETAGVELSVEGSQQFVADRQRLQQLLENLLRNAVEHAGPDVTTIGPLTKGSGFYVEDTGPGIPEAERTKIFEMGYSGDADGTGFGLAICQQIAEAHGWSIEVMEGNGGGARFEVSGVEVG